MDRRWKRLSESMCLSPEMWEITLSLKNWKAFSIHATLRTKELQWWGIGNKAREGRETSEGLGTQPENKQANNLAHSQLLLQRAEWYQSYLCQRGQKKCHADGKGTPRKASWWRRHLHWAWLTDFLLEGEAERERGTILETGWMM